MSAPNLALVENNPIVIPPNKINTSKTACDYCCKKIVVIVNYQQYNYVKKILQRNYVE